MIYQSLNLISQSERGPVFTGQGIPCKENGPAAKYFGETWDSAYLRKETTNVILKLIEMFHSDQAADKSVF